jgi:hypothetical protein
MVLHCTTMVLGLLQLEDEGSQGVTVNRWANVATVRTKPPSCIVNTAPLVVAQHMYNPKDVRESASGTAAYPHKRVPP